MIRREKKSESAARNMFTALTKLHALPFWVSFLTIPLAWAAAMHGGWTLLLVPLVTWGLFSLLDALGGLDAKNPDPETPDDVLFWHRLGTLLWAPAQAFTVFGLIWYGANRPGLETFEIFGLAFSMGVLSGTIGIVYAHELIHQQNRLERWLGDMLLTMVLYGHFRSEHLRVHHRYVGTPRDPATARYNEGFHRFFPRVLKACLVSAWRAEADMLARKNLGWWHSSNPFWRYGVLSVLWLAVAYALGGWLGIVMFATQAFVAIWQLELVNYVEHYGLTRKHLGDGKYEPTKPHHSWNATPFASNRLLINLQRHSDHHYKPHRRFPLLQTYSEDEAPQLPYGYPVMTTLAMIPPLWRRRMNPRVRSWRKKYYPEILDWKPYSSASNPVPK